MYPFDTASTSAWAVELAGLRIQSRDHLPSDAPMTKLPLYAMCACNHATNPVLLPLQASSPCRHIRQQGSS